MRPSTTPGRLAAQRPPCSLSKYLVLVAVTALSVGASAAPVATLISSCMTITTSGSYLVTTNLTAGPPGVCLDVRANHVTIDLGGWTIEGIISLAQLPFGGVGYTVRNGIVGRPPGLHHCGVNARHSSEIVIEGIIFDQCHLVGGASIFGGESIIVRNSIFFGGGIKDVGEALITGNLLGGIEVNGVATIIGNTFTAEGGHFVGVGGVLKDNMIVGDVFVGRRHMVVNNAIHGTLHVFGCPGLELGNVLTGGVVSPPGCTAVGNAP